MLFNFKLDDLIPILVIGAISIIALYHTILYYFSKLKLVGSYTIYLWFALLYLVLAVTIVPQKTFVTPNLYFLISSGVFWISLLCYLNFLLVALDLPRTETTSFYKMITKTYLITPIYFLLRFPYFFFPSQFVQTVKACGFIMDSYLFVIFGYVAYLFLKTKKGGAANYIVIGNILILSFNLFTSITYFTQGFIFNLSHVSFIALGYFSDIIFFSLAVGLQMRENIKDKYIALHEVSKKELALELERQKASDILLSQDFAIAKERDKAIIEQRTTIGRKLHDDLSGSLVALRYFIGDKIRKADSVKEAASLSEIDEELKSIYEEARDYSHLLSKPQIQVLDNFYNVSDYLDTLKIKLEKLNLFKIVTEYSKSEIDNLLDAGLSKQLYYFIKESLSNVIKHAEANQVVILIKFNNNSCIVTVKDNGKGFINRGNNDGQGIKNMRNRAKELNGTIEICTTVSGTEIKICFPIKGNEKS